MLSLLAKILDCDDFCVLASKNKREKSLCEGNESHACVSRAYQQRFNFFCCHKCHTRREKVKKKMEKPSKRKGRKKCFSLLWYADFEWSNRLSVKICPRCDRNVLEHRSIGNVLWHLWQQKDKNSCDARIWARVRVGISLLFLHFVTCGWCVLNFCCSVEFVFASASASETTRRFVENNVLFYRKWRVVLWKTTCCFIENNVLFCAKWAVVFSHVISMPCILSLYQTPKGDAAKMSFATFPLLDKWGELYWR